MTSKLEEDGSDDSRTEYLVTTLADAKHILRVYGNTESESRPPRDFELPPIRVKMRVRFSGGTPIPEDVVSEIDGKSCLGRADLRELQAAEGVVLAWINRKKRNAAQFIVDPIGSIFKASPDLGAAGLRSLEGRSPPTHNSPSRYAILHSVEVDADVETSLPNAKS